MTSSSWDEANPEYRQRVASLAELGVMTASLLHELRQPLFIMKAKAELAAASTPEIAPQMQSIVDQASHIEQLLTAYGGIGQATDTAAFDANGPVRSATEMFAYRSRQLGASLRTELYDGPLLVQGREHAIKQVAINLLQNALDATEEVSDRRVIVRTISQGAHVVIEIEDSGPGFPRHLQDQAFDAFVSSKAADRGTGLGLYITRLIVEQTGGDVNLHDGPTGGTLVRVRLPLASL
jgi:signal transduction histidine kinase